MSTENSPTPPKKDQNQVTLEKKKIGLTYNLTQFT